MSLTFEEWWAAAVEAANTNLESYALFRNPLMSPLLKELAKIAWEAAQANPEQRGL